jgi:DNA invertase Pin-like site-specific DNA recombinase
MRAVTYLRVSTREQSEEGYSLAAQREACRRHIKEQGWEAVAEFCDAGESARSTDRPQYQALLAYLVEHPVDALVVHRLDRLARNLEDHAALRARLRHLGVQLASVTENLEDSPAGKLIESILAALNEFYSASLGQEVRKGQHQKLREGGWPGRAPLGYLNKRGPDGRGPSVLEPDPDRDWLVRQAFELYGSGEWSLTALSAELADRGLRTSTGGILSRSKLAALLANPLYVGRLRWNGTEADGVHTPLVSTELFARAQSVLAMKQSGERQRRHTHPLKGLLVCGACGARLTLTVAKGRFGYFFCLGTQRTAERCQEPYLPVEQAEEWVLTRWRELRLTPGARRELETALGDAVAVQGADAKTAAAGLRRRLDRLARDRDRLLRAFYDEAIDSAQLTRERGRLEAETDHARRLLADATATQARLTEVERIARALATDLGATYARAGAAVRTTMNRAAFALIAVRNARIRAFALQPGFEAGVASTEAS